MEKTKQTKEDLLHRIDILSKDNDALFADYTSLRHSNGGLKTSLARTKKALEDTKGTCVLLEKDVKSKTATIQQLEAELRKSEIECNRLTAILGQIKAMNWYERLFFKIEY